MSDRPTILLCRCTRGGRVGPADSATIAGALTQYDVHVTVVDDLCELSATRDPLLNDLVEQQDLTVIACHPRAIAWLFESAGAPLPDEATTLNAADATDPDEIVTHFPDRAGTAKIATLPGSAGDWSAWFPVIDYERCNGCDQCRNFCLFGVYDRPDDRTVVANPHNCKLLCPACARVCPQGAIIFPKDADPSINGGDRPPGTRTLEAALEGDVYEALRNRSVSHDEMRQALAERNQCACDCQCGDDRGCQTDTSCPECSGDSECSGDDG